MEGRKEEKKEGNIKVPKEAKESDHASERRRRKIFIQNYVHTQSSSAKVVTTGKRKGPGGWRVGEKRRAAATD